MLTVPPAGAPGASVLLTGASGFIGRSLLGRLLEMDRQVAVLTRGDGGGFQAGVRIHRADLSTGSGLSSALFDGVNLVIHCAGEIRDPAAMRALHVEGTRALLRAAAGRRGGAPLHWVQVSSVGAYGPGTGRDGRVVIEATPERPRGEYEVTKTESDHLVRQAADGKTLSCTILRPSNVIGRRMPSASFRALVEMVRRRLFFYIGPPGAVATYVHVDDVVSALLACAFHPAAPGQIFNLSSDCLLESLIDEIARVLGVRAPRVRLPEGLVRAAVRLLEGRSALPLTSARVNALVSRTRYPSSHISSVLGFGLARPMPAGVAELIEGAGA